jgi:hypothetical protein
MIIAERILKLRDRAPETPVPVRIFAPAKDNGTWTCRWEISWPDRTRTNVGAGVDSAQALVHALQMVGAELYGSEEHRSGRLTWAPPRIGYGFPVPNNIRELLIGDDAQFL